MVGTFTPSCGSLSKQAQSLSSYGWPVKPFDGQHPVRGNLNDPRFGGGAKSIDLTADEQEHFHFGVDISALDGTPVYAVESGEVHLDSAEAGHLAIVSPNRVVSYWHVKPILVRHKQQVSQGQLIAYIQSPWGHVHLAELSGGRYLNPLRPGALSPYEDSVAPVLRELVALSNEGSQVSLQGIRGSLSLAINAYDLPPIKPSAPWNDIKVTPALISWSMKSLSGEQILKNTVAVDFRTNSRLI